MQKTMIPTRNVRPLMRRSADFRPLHVDSRFGGHWYVRCPHRNHLSLFVWIRVHSWLNCISPAKALAPSALRRFTLVNLASRFTFHAVPHNPLSLRTGVFKRADAQWGNENIDSTMRMEAGVAAMN